MRSQTRIVQGALQGLFAEYNRRYWRDRLPCYEVVISEKHWGSACDRKHRRIYMHPVLFDRLSEAAIQRTLIHEMAHAATRGIHGRAWQQEMRRLKRMGAPVDPEDLQPDSIDSRLSYGVRRNPLSVVGAIRRTPTG